MNRVFWLAVLLLFGCAGVEAQREYPAIVSSHTVEGLAELEAVVSQAFHGTRVTLADTVLTDNSYLLVGRKPHQGVDGALLVGTDLTMPRRFQLLYKGGRCILEDLENQRRWELQQLRCEPSS